MAAATGSPASRRSTKLIPLTTRPSLTSRQGMTRTFSITRSSLPCRADQPQRLAGVEPAIVEGTAGDGTGELRRTGLEYFSDVVEGGEAARRDHRDRDRIGERDGGVEIEPLEQAVPGNVGVDDRGNAGILETPRDVERGEFGGFGPALHRHLTVAGIEADR